jgi:hypothetical protein
MLVQLRSGKVLRRKLHRQVERSVDCSVNALTVNPLTVNQTTANQPGLSTSVQVRLSEDVMVMAQTIATEWGLKNPRDAVEAVFRKYANEYMYGRQNAGKANNFMDLGMQAGSQKINYAVPDEVQCEAMNELDGLLGL